MESIRIAARRLPPGAVIRLLRKVMAYPTPAARLIVHDFCRPRKFQRAWIHKVAWNGKWSGCWIGENVRDLDEAALDRRIHDADMIIFNVHGGAFRLGTPTMYMAAYLRWIKYCKVRHGMNVMIMSINYRLAPEYKYPSPVEDVMRAYEYLIQTLNIDANKVVMTGDSTGACLVLEMLFITHDPSMFEVVTDDPNSTGDANLIAELPRPAGVMLSSPLVTDQTDSPSWQENIKYDYVSHRVARVIKREYFEHPVSETGDPASEQYPILGLAKLQTGFRAFLPKHVLFYIGGKEVLRDDALGFAEKASRDGVDVKVVKEDLVHNWYCVREVVKDRAIVTRADVTFADFCKQSLESAKPVRESISVPPPRRESEPLAMVLEDDEEQIESEDDFQEAQSMTVVELEAAIHKKLDEQVPPSNETDPAMTVYV